MCIILKLSADKDLAIKNVNIRDGPRSREIKMPQGLTRSKNQLSKDVLSLCRVTLLIVLFYFILFIFLGCIQNT